MERMIYLCSNKPNKAKSTKEDASKIVAQELHDDWIKKNVYPICAKNIAKKILKDYKSFVIFLRQLTSAKSKCTDSGTER